MGLAGWRALGREGGATLTMAWPIVLGSLAQQAQHVTNVLMMARLGPDTLAAGTLAMSLFGPLLYFASGVLGTLTPLVAQALGAGDADSGRKHLRDAAWLAAGFTLLAAPLSLGGEPLLRLLGRNPLHAALGAEFLLVMAAALPAMLAVVALRGVLTAHGLNGAVIAIRSVGAALNALGGHLATSGILGAPLVGLAGIAASTLIANLAVLGLLIAYLGHRRLLSDLAGIWPPLPRRRAPLLRVGLPVGISILSESLLFTAVVFLLARIGAAEVAAYGLASQYLVIALALHSGICAAAMVRVGWAYGVADRDAIRVRATAGATIGLASITLAALTMLALSATLVTAVFDPRGDLRTLAMAIAFVKLTALLQLVDGLQCVFAFMLRGVSDTAVPLLLTSIGYWPVGFGIAYLLAVPLGLGGEGVYLGLIAGFGFIAIALGWRVARRMMAGTGKETR